MVKRRLVLATTLALFGVAACQLVLGLNKPEEFDPVSDAGDAGRDGGIEGGIVATCVPSVFPPRPQPDAASDAAPNMDRLYYMAIRSFSLGSQDNLPGVNLDCADTCSEAGPAALSCVPRQGGDICDEPRGVDNQVARIAKNKLFITVDESLGAQSIQAGKFGEVIVLKNYNGLPDDESVGVGFAPSPGFSGRFGDGDGGLGCREIRNSPIPDSGPSCGPPGTSCSSDADGRSNCCGNCNDDGGCSPLPQWNGCDSWILDTGFAVGRDDKGEPLSYIPGYVLDSVLYVLPSDQSRIPLQLGGTVAVLRAAGLVARVERIDKDGVEVDAGDRAERIRLRGALVFGRLSPRELLGFALQTRPCLPFSVVEPFVKDLCKSQDVALDLTNPGATCDAFSTGFLFDTESAESGPVGDASVGKPCVVSTPDGASVDSLFDCP
jgi:hypothetical protein